VLGLVQSGRCGGENKRPTRGFRDGGDLEQADAVMFAYRPAYYLARAEDQGTDEEKPVS
jgi:replicative DNA helicase